MDPSFDEDSLQLYGAVLEEQIDKPKPASDQSTDLSKESKKKEEVVKAKKQK